MRNARTATLAVALALISGVASANCVLGRLAEFSVTMSGLQPVVGVKVNGADVRLLADSGGFFSTLTPGTARELKLSTQPAPYGFSLKGIGGEADVAFANVKTFTLGGTDLKNITFLVGGSEVGTNLGGILGRNVFNLADAEYDLANGAIRLMRPAGCSGHPLAYWSWGKSYSAVAMLPDFKRNPAASIYVTVNGVRMIALLDTGSSTSVLFSGAAKKAGITVADAGAAKLGASGGIGRRLVGAYSAHLADIKIGDEEIKNTRIRVLETTIDDTDLLLGADFFLSHRVYVSNSQQKVFFTYNGGPVFNLVTTRIDAPPPEPAAGTGAATVASPQVEPTDAAGFSRRGQAFAARRDFARALSDLDRAVALAPDNADYVYQRGVARVVSGQMFLAMADFEQTLKLRPGDSAALLARAELRFMGHDAAGAARDLDEVARTVSPESNLRLSLGGLYERADRMDEAAAQYTIWIAAHPDDNRRPAALNGRCWARALLNRELDKALADCNGALRANSKNFAFLNSRGLVFLRMGAFAKSIADYDASIVLRPRNAWSFYGRGLAKLQSGDAEGGAADVAAAAAINHNIVLLAARYGVKP